MVAPVPVPNAPQIIECEHCRGLLGEVFDDGKVRQRHRGRTTIFTGVISIQCERCERWTHAPRPVMNRFLTEKRHRITR